MGTSLLATVRGNRSRASSLPPPADIVPNASIGHWPILKIYAMAEPRRTSGAVGILHLLSEIRCNSCTRRSKTNDRTRAIGDGEFIYSTASEHEREPWAATAWALHEEKVHPSGCEKITAQSFTIHHERSRCHHCRDTCPCPGHFHNSCAHRCRRGPVPSSKGRQAPLRPEAGQCSAHAQAGRQTVTFRIYPPTR